MSAKIVPAPQRLRALLGRPGGVTEEAAVAKAGAAVAAMRPQLVAGLIGEIGLAIGLTEGEGARVDPATCAAMRGRVAAIYNLAGTCGFDPLRRVAASLLDLLTVFEAGEGPPKEALRVHLRAAQYMSPGGAAVSATEAALILTDLAKLSEHLQDETAQSA